MNWKFWKWNTVDMTDLVPEGDYTVGDIIESMSDEQLGNQLYCDLGSFFRGKISFIEVCPNFIGKTVGGVRE